MDRQFYLVDYKGKFDIICDSLDDFDFNLGMIAKKDAIEQAPWRNEKAIYYGVPAYVGKDEELNKIYG